MDTFLVTKTFKMDFPPLRMHSAHYVTQPKRSLQSCNFYIHTTVRNKEPCRWTYINEETIHKFLKYMQTHIFPISYSTYVAYKYLQRYIRKAWATLLLPTTTKIYIFFQLQEALLQFERLIFWGESHRIIIFTFLCI